MQQHNQAMLPSEHGKAKMFSVSFQKSKSCLNFMEHISSKKLYIYIKIQYSVTLCLKIADLRRVPKPEPYKITFLMLSVH